MKHCYVISNNEFESDGRILGYRAGQDANLPGYIADTELICTTFTQLGFEVKCERNKSAEDMKTIVQNWSDGDFSHAECIAVVILTHGGEQGIIYGSDNKELELNFVFSRFELFSFLSFREAPSVCLASAHFAIMCAYLIYIDLY